MVWRQQHSFTDLSTCGSPVVDIACGPNDICDHCIGMTGDCGVAAALALRSGRQLLLEHELRGADALRSGVRVDACFRTSLAPQKPIPRVLCVCAAGAGCRQGAYCQGLRGVHAGENLLEEAHVPHSANVHHDHLFLPFICTCLRLSTTTSVCSSLRSPRVLWCAPSPAPTTSRKGCSPLSE